MLRGIVDRTDSTLSGYDVDQYQGHSFGPFRNQFGQVGYLVDMWADVIEGFGSQTNEFWKAFYEARNARDVPRLKTYWEELRSTGFSPKMRRMSFNKRGPVTVALLIAKQGNDLYVSWRAFIQNRISAARVIVWILLVLLASVPASVETHWWGGYEINVEILAASFGAGIIATGLLIILFGLFRQNGDAWALLRPRIHELQYDEIASLSTVIHQCILDAADKLGIDKTKLEPREPTYLGRSRKRRI